MEVQKVWLEKRGGNKKVCLIKGFIGSEVYLKDLNNQEFEIEDYEEKYYDGKVVYSSDSLLKVFTFTGDAYFAYFTSISKSYLHMLDKNKK